MDWYATRIHLVEIGSSPHLFNSDSDDADPVIPGVEEIFRLGPEVELEDVRSGQAYIQVKPDEAQTWKEAHEVLMAQLKGFADEEDRLRASHRQQMEEIDRQRLTAWAGYENINNTISANKM